MKTCITGGCGFIGSHLADKLVEQGDEVLVLDNLSTGFQENLPPKAQFKRGSIAEASWLNAVFANFRPDVTVHAAASYKDPTNWFEDAQTNVVGTANVVKACQMTGCKRLIYFNTALCYGLHPAVPTPVDHPLLAEGTSYAISKTAGEKLVSISGLDWVVFRLATTIGPRNISGPVPTFYQRLKTNKPVYVSDTKREFIYIQDLLRLIMAAIEGKGSGAYNACRGTDYHIKDVLTGVCLAMEIPVPQFEVRPMGKDDTYTILLDPARTKKDFGWEAIISLETAVTKAVHWYDKHGVGETYTHLTLKK